MPTIPKRATIQSRRQGGLDLLSTVVTRTEVTEMQLKWQDRPCPAPPCKQAFWWASHPKPVKIKGCPK